MTCDRITVVYSMASQSLQTQPKSRARPLGPPHSGPRHFKGHCLTLF